MHVSVILEWGGERKYSSYPNFPETTTTTNLSPTNPSFSICRFRPKFHYQLHLKSLECQNPIFSSQRNRSAFTHKKFCQKFAIEIPNFLYLDDCGRSGFGFGQINPVNRFNNVYWNSIGHYLHILHILGCSRLCQQRRVVFCRA